LGWEGLRAVSLEPAEAFADDLPGILLLPQDKTFLSCAFKPIGAVSPPFCADKRNSSRQKVPTPFLKNPLRCFTFYENQEEPDKDKTLFLFFLARVNHGRIICLMDDESSAY
jgi:hypothetical protein